jgi:hypothetical protein
LALTTTVCSRCGFETTDGSTVCPWCVEPDATPSLAARQVAGLALPTRSVHHLPSLPPRRERVARPVGPADGARSAFGFSTIFVLLVFVGLGLSWLAHPTHFGLTLPDGTAELVDRFTVVAAWGAVIAVGVGVAAMLGWCVRRLVAAIAGRPAP